MTALAPFSWDASGHLLVGADGPELIAYSGLDGKPVWKQFCDGILVGVAVRGPQVHAVDTDGTLTTWRASDGEKLGEVRLGLQARGLEVAPGGLRLVIGQDGVVLVGEMGDARRIQVPGVTSAAFGQGAMHAVAGTEAGRVVLLDVVAGAPVAEAPVGAPVTDVAWSSDGRWAVAAGREILLLGQELGENAVLKRIAVEAPVRHVAVSSDATVIAADDGEVVRIFEAWEGRQAGTVTYTREIGELAFGPQNMLGIGLEYADVDMVDVMSGKTRQTQAGLGRAREPWFPRVKVDAHLLRGATTSKRTGGGPIASLSPTLKGTSRGRGEEGGNRALTIGSIVVGAMLLCCGCSAVSTSLWYVLGN